mmetsp:Transcript_10878/g.16459  ORF Transcript_10878/g.16459 Transcript_10878/m.16459 type:complete len:114 (-) Transcript_10878:266-607(-)
MLLVMDMYCRKVLLPLQRGTVVPGVSTQSSSPPQAFPSSLGERHSLLSADTLQARFADRLVEKRPDGNGGGTGGQSHRDCWKVPCLQTRARDRKPVRGRNLLGPPVPAVMVTS